MPRPRRITDAQIDAAARETFLEHGHSAPVALIAAKLGVSHAALLQRAGSKDNLLLRALSPAPLDREPSAAAPVEAETQSPLGRLVAALGEPPPERGRAARLVDVLVELHGVLATLLPGLIVLRARGLPTGPPPGIEAPTLRLRRLVAEWLVRTKLVSKTRAPALSEALLGAIEARCFNAHLGGPTFVDESPRALVERLVAALLPELGRLTPQRKGKTR